MSVKAIQNPERFVWKCPDKECAYEWSGENYRRAPPHPFCPQCREYNLRQKLALSEWEWGL